MTVVQSDWFQCREIGYETHEEILRVLDELHTTMKTYQTYQTGSRQAETKLRVAEQQRSKLEVANAPPEKLARSKKYKLMEKEVNKVGWRCEIKAKPPAALATRPCFSILSILSSVFCPFLSLSFLTFYLSFYLLFWPWRGRVYFKTREYQFPPRSSYTEDTWTEATSYLCILLMNKAPFHSSPCQNFTPYHY